MGDAWEGRDGMVHSGRACNRVASTSDLESFYHLSIRRPPGRRPAAGRGGPARRLAWLALARRYLCVACVWRLCERLCSPCDVRWNCPPFITTCARSNRRARAHTLMMNSGGSQRRVKQRRESGVDAVAASPASRPGVMPACRRCWEELSVQERQTAALLGFEQWSWDTRVGTGAPAPTPPPPTPGSARADPQLLRRETPFEARERGYGSTPSVLPLRPS